MAISTIGTDALASAAVTSAKLASGAPSRSQLPAGTVLQVVQGTKSGKFTTTATSYSSTGLSATITPTSATSKILILVNATDSRTGDQNHLIMTVYRNGSLITTGVDIWQRAMFASWGYLEVQCNGSISYLDSPATTSPITYTLYAASGSSSNTASINWNEQTSYIQLLEIAA